MDELKNLVIQTLETNGILGQLRAQLRSCVFKVIDNQEQVEKGQSSFHWENPNARKVMQTASGVICAELVREFLEFYRLDYTLQIYLPEVNLNKASSMSKEDLARRAGLTGATIDSKPIMVQLLENFLSGDRSAPAAPAQPENIMQKKEDSHPSVQ
jgi:FGFR1 oncogene partner